MTSGYAVIELTGAAAFAVLQLRIEISSQLPSASVARLFSGHVALLYASGPARYRLHCQAAALESLWELLATFAKQADSYAQET